MAVESSTSDKTFSAARFSVHHSSKNRTLLFPESVSTQVTNFCQRGVPTAVTRGTTLHAAAPRFWHSPYRFFRPCRARGFSTMDSASDSRTIRNIQYGAVK